MKAPDKIFMPNELLSEEWERHIEGQDIEYIRKEAILEWAKGKQAQASLKENLSEFTWDKAENAGMQKAFQILINHIESL